MAAAIATFALVQLRAGMPASSGGTDAPTIARGARVPAIVGTTLDGHVLLVDDVITTGATLIAALDALATANCRSVTVLALALAPASI